MQMRFSRVSCVVSAFASAVALAPFAPARAQGNVACWGSNMWDQCSVPSGLTSVRSIAAGGDWDDAFTVVVKADGSVLGWGDNYYGQIVPPIGLSAAVQVAASEAPRTVVLLSNGRVVSWGADWSGGTGLIYGTDVGDLPITEYSGSPQLGDPVRFRGVVFTQGQQVAAGRNHSVALTRSGQVVSWGSNYYYSGSDAPPVSWLLFGTKSDGTAQSGFLGQPAEIRGAVISATQVVAGDDFTGVRMAGGAVACLQEYFWPPYSFDVTPPAGLPAVAELAGGYDHLAARLSDGSVVCWGSNRYGESLGTGLNGSPILTKPTGAPVRINGQILYSVAKVAVGSEHTIALLTSGKVVAWGRNNAGQSLGTSASGAPILGVANGQYAKVGGNDLVSVTAIAAGEGHSVALIGSAVSAVCPADLDGSGQVDFGDVAVAMLDFGPCAECPTDLDGSGQVDFGDIALTLLDFGPCSP